MYSDGHTKGFSWDDLKVKAKPFHFSALRVRGFDSWDCTNSQGVKITVK